jgi:hypothetical protein
MHTIFVRGEPVVNLYDLISWGHGTKTVFEIESEPEENRRPASQPQAELDKLHESGESEQR